MTTLPHTHYHQNYDTKLYSQSNTNPICSAKDAHKLLKEHFNPHVEEFWGIYLNHHLKLLNLSLLTRGTLNNCPIHPRDLFREAITHNSFTIILAHNHVSHSLEPSNTDIKTTRKLKKCGELLEIPILDHIIFNSEEYYSFKEHQSIF
ncbi:MAG: JAB domain-containing protein [Pseudobdellovibrio sp.]